MNIHKPHEPQALVDHVAKISAEEGKNATKAGRFNKILVTLA